MFGKDKGPDLGKIQDAVNGAGGSGVRDLSVRQNGNVVEIHGRADNLGSKQQAFRTITEKVGDMAVVNMIQVATEPSRNVNSSQPQGLGGMASSAATFAAGGQGRRHTVAKGETLSHIAQRYYGKASESDKIFEANRDQLKDPDKIREGMTLNIP